MLGDRDRQVLQTLEAELLSDPVFRSAVLPVARLLRLRSAPVVVGVPVDGQAADAVRWAAVEAAGQGCPLRLVLAVAGPADPDAVHALEAAAALARSVVPDLDVTTRLVPGPAARVLVQESRDARLLVLGAATAPLPRGVLGRLLAGSLRSRVAAAACCPVAVVHPRPPLAARRSPHVVVGIDGSAGSGDAVAFAFRCASQRGIALTAVHAWSADPPADLEAVAAPLATTEAAAHALTDGALAGWRELYPDVPVHTVVVRRDPARALLVAAADAALVVVGTRGRGRAHDAVFGSVSRAVLDRVAAPVAVVRRSTSAEFMRPAVG